MSGPVTASDRLDARYGRTRGRRMRVRVIAVVAGIGILVAAVAWSLWVGLAGPATEVETREIAFQLADDHVTVRWELNAPADRPARCVVEALSERKNVVGWKTVDVPASSTRVRIFVDTVRTVEKPVTGLIWRCWLT